MTADDVGSLLAWGGARLRGAAGAAAWLESEVLLAWAARVRREWLMAHPEAVPRSAAVRAYRAAVERRRAERVPVAYLVGSKEFAGLRFAMRPGVFIPRPETEGLLELAEARLRPRLPLPRGSVVVDACAGSGAVGIALARRLGVRIVATDVSGAAIALVRENARRLGVARLVRTVVCDGLAGVGRAFRVAAVVSNPPYVRQADIPGLPRDIRLHEPRAALAAGIDGLSVIRRLVRAAARRLETGGLLALEIAPGQGRAVLGFMGRSPWAGARLERDLAGRVRYAVATAENANSAASGALPGDPLRNREPVDRVRS